MTHLEVREAQRPSDALDRLVEPDPPAAILDLLLPIVGVGRVIQVPGNSLSGPECHHSHWLLS